MSIARRLHAAAILAAVLSTSCDTGFHKAAAAGGAPRTGAELIDAYLMAHGRRDVDAALELVCMDGVQDRQRTERLYREEFQAVFDLPVSRVQVVPRRADQITEYRQRGTTYRTNLEVTGNLLVEYAQGAAPASTSYPIGRKDGVFYITTAAPVP